MKLHEGEVDIDVPLVERLLADQFPQLAELPLQPVESIGTVNAIYRLGEDLCARLPRVAGWADSLERELRWLPRLAPHISLAIPEPVGRGAPAHRYPFVWAIYRWIDGEPYSDGIAGDEERAASELARFVTELRRIDPSGGPRGGRKPLRQLDEITREALAAAGASIDAGAAAAIWTRALEAPPWDGEPVWIHTDLLRPNLLVAGGRLRAVIDFGGAGVGDPAADVIAAWSVFGPSGREAFRRCLDVGDDTWNRARGYALHQAVLIIPYYRHTNPAFVELAKRTVEQVLADAGG